MLTTIRYVLLTATRDWVFYVLLVALAGSIGISTFLGNVTLVENDMASAAYSAGVSRIILMIGLMVFVSFYVRRAFENREIELIITRPITRTQFVVACWLGFMAVSTLLLLLLAAVIFAVFTVNMDGMLYWTANIFMEFSIVLAFTLFASLILKSAFSAVMLSFAFYFMSRLMGFFLYVLNAPHAYKGDIVSVTTEYVLSVASAILPRLDLFSQSAWVMSGIGNTGNYTIIIAQACIATLLFMAMAIYDFKRKQF